MGALPPIIRMVDRSCPRGGARTIAIVLSLFATALAPRVVAQIDVLYLYNSNGYTDMCQAIAAAATRYPGLTLDARGFVGTQYCSAANATNMFGTSASSPPPQGKLLLGPVTMVVDGPPSGISATACLGSGNVATVSFPSAPLPAGTTFQPGAAIKVENGTSGCLNFNAVSTVLASPPPTSTTVSYTLPGAPVGGPGGATVSQSSYTDGVGLTPSSYGTPAVIIPNQYWGIQGLSRGATTIQICAGASTPVPQCKYPFPQRVFSVTSTSIGSGQMTVNVGSSLALGNIFPGEYVHLVGDPNSSPGLPALKVVSSTSSSLTVRVPSGYTHQCSPCASGSFAYLMTPAVGFGPSSGPYSPAGGTNTNSFGQHLRDISISLGYTVGTTRHGYLGSVGIQNVYCEETCGVDNVSVNFIASIGLEDYSTTSQNAGPWTNVVMSTNNNVDCDYGTTGMALADAPNRGVSGWTIALNGAGTGSSNCNGHEPVAAILMDKPATPILHGHNENTQDAILVGSQGAVINASQKPVGGVKVEEVLGPPSNFLGTNIVHVSNVFGTGTNATVSNVFRNIVQPTRR